MENLTKGSRIKVFDYRLFENDKETPLSITMQSATVLRCYRRKGDGEEVVDVEFDYRPGEISEGHFVWAVELID